MERKKGILVVSFGTSYENTRRLTISAIENTIHNTYPDIPFYTAWTSRMIVAKLFKTTGEKVFNVNEALEQMAKDEITDVYIQTTHVINGIEYDLLKEDALKHRDSFTSISFGKPLLSSTEDMQKVVRIIADEFSDILSYGNSETEALVLMGHGTEHHSNAGYAALDYMFKEMGYPNIHIGTVESYPSLDQIFTLLNETPAKKIHLAPFMIVAGDHANHDMAGEDEDSWASRCQAKGYDVICHLKGLGEYPKIHDIFLEHLNEVLL